LVPSYNGYVRAFDTSRKDPHTSCSVLAGLYDFDSERQDGSRIPENLQEKGGRKARTTSTCKATGNAEETTTKYALSVATQVNVCSPLQDVIPKEALKIQFLDEIYAIVLHAKLQIDGQ